MSIANSIRESLESGSWIREMFEEGARLKAEKGEENVFDFSPSSGNFFDGFKKPNLLIEISRLRMCLWSRNLQMIPKYALQQSDTTTNWLKTANFHENSPKSRRNHL